MSDAGAAWAFAFGGAGSRAARGNGGGVIYGAWLPRLPFVEHVVRVAVLYLDAVLGMIA